MNGLRDELLQINQFELLARKLMSKEIINKAKDFLTQIKASDLVKPKEFLSAFMIYKFPEDSVGSKEIEENKKVIDFSKLLIECEDNNIEKHAIKFSYNFRIWKEQDIKIIKQQLFNEYHQLTVDIIDTEDEDKKIIFDTVKEEILKCAQNVGGKEFVEQIKNYTPILMNIDELKDQYDKAYYDLLCEEFNNKKYKRLENLLNFINGTLRNLNSVGEINRINEIFDVEFIIQRFRRNAYSQDELESICCFMYDLVKNIQSASRDREVENYKAELKVKEIYFPDVVMNIMKLIRNIMNDLEKLKENLESK